MRLGRRFQVVSAARRVFRPGVKLQLPGSARRLSMLQKVTIRRTAAFVLESFHRSERFRPASRLMIGPCGGGLEPEVPRARGRQQPVVRRKNPGQRQRRERNPRRNLRPGVRTGRAFPVLPTRIVRRRPDARPENPGKARHLLHHSSRVLRPLLWAANPALRAVGGSSHRRLGRRPRTAGLAMPRRNRKSAVDPVTRGTAPAGGVSRRGPRALPPQEEEMMPPLAQRPGAPCIPPGARMRLGIGKRLAAMKDRRLRFASPSSSSVPRLRRAAMRVLDTTVRPPQRALHRKAQGRAEVTAPRLQSMARLLNPEATDVRGATPASIGTWPIVPLPTLHFLPEPPRTSHAAVKPRSKCRTSFACTPFSLLV